MSVTLVAWCAILLVLVAMSLGRPSYAIGVYMLTYFAHPLFWWWGDPIEGYRWNFYAGLLLIGTLLVSQRREATKQESPLSTNAVRILVLMAANIILVHFLFAVNPEASFGWLTNRLKFILLFFLMQYAIRDEKDYTIVAMSIALGMGYIGFEATINERGSFSGGRLEGIGAAGVTSSNQLASLLITGLPLATTVLFTAVSRWTKGVAILCCALAFNVVLMCNSRGAFLGVLATGVVFLFMASGPARKHSNRLAALALVGTFMLLGDPAILERFMTTFSSQAQQDRSAQSRIVFWTAASGMVRDYPLGSGGNSFSEGRGWAYMPNARTIASDTRAIHNGFLTEATDWGLQGFLLMMLFLWAVWRTCLRGRRLARSEGNANAMMAFACIAGGLLAWMVSSVFGDYLDQEWGFWLAAMSYSYLRVHGVVAEREQALPADTFQASRAAQAPPLWPRGAV
jgi:O-antigen ligase